MKRVFVLLLMGWLAFLPAQGQGAPPAFEKAESAPEEAHDPFDPMVHAPRLIRVQVEHIELSHKELTRLMMEEKAETADAKALRMKVQELVEKDEAKVIDTQIVLGRSGQKQTTESRQEFIYPTEYTPEAIEKKIEESIKQAMASSFPFNPATPTAFETRNLGCNLESEPTLGTDDRTIDLRIESELKWHTGNTVWSEIKDSAGSIHRIAMPDFYVMTTKTSITSLSGQYALVGAPSPKNAEGKLDTERKVMVFVKCDVLSVVP